MKLICIIVFFLSINYVITANVFEPSVVSQSPRYYEENDIQNGNNDAFFVEKYGPPVHEFMKPRYKFAGEYYIGLNQTYRITNPEFKDIPIKEMFWNLQEDLNLTCWFHYKDGQWRVISYIFWPPGAKF
ncbi:hypothetical protein G893_00826 [Escherichia coli KOEGE 71 (186a)]|uniref:hypothetical protein n=1 Tax=Escherichia coli TaxID=562 RepID=UPI0003912335|nr:hypothetical protein [Escherichia coli]EQV94454.1 hypothetical protein G893_00826 [Escherichia coli KOEGE 71 (186a)]